MRKLFNKLVMLVLITVPNYSYAQDIKKNYCIQKLSTPDDLGRINSIKEFDFPPYEIFLFGNSNANPSILYEGKLQKLNVRVKDFYQLENSKVMAYGRDKKRKSSLFEFDSISNSFNKIKILGMDNFDRISHISWSSPMGGYLISQNSTLGLHGSKKEPSLLFLVKDKKATKLKDLEGWITKIVDFPELNLTFLGTQGDDTIYLIDGDKNIKRLESLFLGKWKYFSHVYHLKNPDRLLVRVDEAMGPYKGLFVINIEKANGVWRASENQKLKNIRERFAPPNKHYPDYSHSFYSKKLNEYFLIGRDYNGISTGFLDSIFQEKKEMPIKLYKVGKTYFEMINEPDATIIDELPSVYKKGLGYSSVQSQTLDYNEYKIRIPRTENAVVFKKNGIFIRDAKDEYLIDDKLVKYNRFSIRQHTKYLENQDAVFVNGQNGLFLIKNINDNCKCECTSSG